MSDQKTTITLAQWCAYLPYGVNVSSNGNQYILGMYDVPLITLDITTAIEYNAKPLLRRPHFDIQKIVDDVYNSKVDWRMTISYDYHENKFYSDSDTIVIPIEHLPNSIVQALLAAHYDIFGLIDKGLALPIEVAEQNNTEKCSSCNIKDAKPLHTCPYASEINNDERLCNCCDNCRDECHGAI